MRKPVRRARVALLHTGACCARPTEGSHGLTTRGPAQCGEGAKQRLRQRARESAARGIVEAGIIHLASLHGGSLILRENCYNVVT
jgi:hypothetical protein